MTVIHGDYPTRKANAAHKGDLDNQEPAPKRDTVSKESAATARSAETLESAGAQIRARLLDIQRAVSRQQQLLGGLIGLRDLMRSEPGAALERLESHVAAVIYQGEPVLKPLAPQLKIIAGQGDFQALEARIAAAEREVSRLSDELGKVEVADQNARSLAARESLAEVARGLRREGGLPQRLSRDNVLKLLG